MAIATYPNIIYNPNAPLDLGSVKNKFKKIATCIPFAGDLLGLPIQAKLARLETDSSNIYHKREILRQSLEYDFFSLVRCYVTFFSTPWLFSLAPASPLIMISLIGSSILLNNIFIFGDLERRFGKSSPMAKIALLAFNCALLCPQLRIFFLTKNILYLNGAVLLGKVAVLLTKIFLFQIKEGDYRRVVSAIQNYESDLRYTLRRNNINLDTDVGRIVQNSLDNLYSLGLNDVDSRTVFRFICRILETADFRNVRNALEAYGFDAVNQPIFLAYQYRVSTIMDNLRDFEEFRGRAIAEMADALEGCQDRIASALNALDILGYIYGAFKPTDDIDSAFLAIRLVRLDHVRQKAYERNPGPEGLETQLFLEIELKDRLQLPLQTQNMTYAGIGRFGINRNILDLITQEILALTSTDAQVVAILTDSCVWTDRLKHHFADFYEDVMRGFEISARGGGLDYAKNLANFSENPTEEWTEFLGQISPDHSQEVMQTLQEICPSLSGKDYNSALTGPNGLIQQINRKKTIEWLGANSDALRAKLNPGA